MSSLIARLRFFTIYFLCFASFSSALQDSLFTSSVTYCEPPESLLIQQFDLIYFAQNKSLWFNVSAASVEANVNVTANLMLNVYGMNPVNITLDLCNILGGALCPLPMYNFIGSDSISLPKSLGISDQIPDIAFKIPDLEAVAQLTLTEISTNKVKACVQATLSNGWSTQQTAVEWSTGGLAIAAFLFAVWQSRNPESLVPFRFLDLFYLYQSIATTGFLSLNFPSLYRSFTLNFAWSMGLLSATPMQNTINQMRHLTGGDLANASTASAVGLVNRRLSPFNIEPQSKLVMMSSFLAAPTDDDLPDLSSLRSFVVTPASLNVKQLSTAGEVTTVTSTSDNVLQAGMGIYTNSIHIGAANAFMTVFLVGLCFIAIILAMITLGYAGLFALSRLQWARQEECRRALASYPPFVRGWALRLSLLMLSPIILFSFYQWTLKDSWLSILLSIISFLAVMCGVTFVIFSIWRIVRQDGPQELYLNKHYITIHGPLYAQHRTPRYWFFLPLFVATFLKSLFVAVIKRNGGVQVILITVIEGLVILANIVLRPANTRGGDVLSTYLAIVRFVCTGLLIAFVEGFSVAPIPRVVVGAVTAVIFSVAIVIMFINLVFHLVQGHLPKKEKEPSEHSSETVTDTERGEKSPISATFTRPRNPTPSANVPLEPNMIEPYPASTPTTATSYYTQESASTTTYGSVLPRRWSLTQDSPWTHDHPRESDEARYTPSVH